MCERVYGYCRISTAKQNIERQERNILAAYPTAIIKKEAFTGTKIEGRKELEKLLKTVREGDTIVFDSVSRMARNASEGTELYFKLYDMGVNLVYIKERHIDTAAYTEALAAAGIQIDTDDTAEGQLISDIVQALNKFMRAKIQADIRKAFEQSEKEVTDLHQRTKEGIETARRNGVLVGGAATAGMKKTTKKSIESKERMKKVCKDFGGQMSDGEAMQMLGLARNTFYKYKKAITEELNS